MFGSYWYKMQKRINDTFSLIPRRQTCFFFVLSSQGWKQKCQELNLGSEPHLSLSGVCVCACVYACVRGSFSRL